MGIDYVLDLPCTPKQQLGVDGLVQLVKARSRAEAVLAMVRERGDARAPAEIELEVALQTPEGTTRQSVTVQELLDEAAPLDALAGHCAGCPASGDAAAFGCYRSVPYPIPEEAEAWLLGLLPDDLSSTAGQLLARALDDFDWDGAPVAEMRAEDGTFFESDEAIGVRWAAPGDGDAPLTIDSDQLFHMLFHVGHLGSTHALMVCLFLGVIPHDVDVAVLGDPDARAAALAGATVPAPPSEACAPLAGFLAALAASARLGVDLLVDG